MHVERLAPRRPAGDTISGEIRFRRRVRCLSSGIVHGGGAQACGTRQVPTVCILLALVSQTHTTTEYRIASSKWPQGSRFRRLEIH